MNPSMPLITTLVSLKSICFLAPTGAQGVTMSVRPFVCAGQSCIEQSIFIFLGQRSIREPSRAIRALKSESSSRSFKYCSLIYNYLKVVSNLTAMNLWDAVCMGFIYTSFLEFVVVNYLARSELKDKIDSMKNNKSLRWVQDPDIQKRKRDNAILDVSNLTDLQWLHVDNSFNHGEMNLKDQWFQYRLNWISFLNTLLLLLKAWARLRLEWM